MYAAYNLMIEDKKVHVPNVRAERGVTGDVARGSDGDAVPV